ncbi:cis-prenyltransferase [Haplosporangium sp. Z 767]|nr:cis-prenyltransferase [Haplosporangium sp. Z 11]KAF9183542.1 cis-prenyltransferase [Haplosporangium sp. Z 767]
MDGNRRYGRKVQVGNGRGYYLGYETLEEILAVCMEMGVKVVTVYAFSIENFKRPPDQVDTLMELAKTKLAELCEHSELVNQYGIGIRVLGNVSLLPDDVRKVVRRAVELTKKNTRAILNMCFPYTSREELTMASRSLVSGIEARELDPSDVTTGVLENSLYTRSCPPMDILIRTSGEIRLSDFMLWQSSRACHVEFIDCFWPEFTFWKLLPILLRYQTRAAFITHFRREYEKRDDSEPRQEYESSHETEVEEDIHRTVGYENLMYHEHHSDDEESSDTSLDSITLHKNSSVSTLVTSDQEDSYIYQALEKKQRVAEFLAHRGHLPCCPMVELQ